MTTKEVKEGLAVVEQEGTSFMQINEAVQHVVNQIQQIGSAIHNLAKDTLEVQQAIHEVNGIAEEAAAGAQNVSATTEEQLASMEEIASSAMDLANMSEELQELIARFKVWGNLKVWKLPKSREKLKKKDSVKSKLKLVRLSAANFIHEKKSDSH